jgi:2-hydroxychromene-2-carboxylate isomerase
MDVEFVYDYRSPYAYLADTQLPTLAPEFCTNRSRSFRS